MILLLGPGKEHLDYRKRVKRDLIKDYKYKEKNIVIMEDIEDKKDFKSIDEKFDFILNHYDPRAIVAFFRNNAQMDAVIFEVGYVCGKYGPTEIAHRFWFAFEEGYDFTITTRYVRNLFTKSQVVSIKDDDEYLNASKILNATLQKT